MRLVTVMGAGIVYPGTLLAQHHINPEQIVYMQQVESQKVGTYDGLSFESPICLIVFSSGHSLYVSGVAEELGARMQ